MKVTIASKYGNINNVSFKVIHETTEGNYLISYASAKKASRNCSGDFYPGLEIYESRYIGGGESFAIINVENAKIVNN